jgi:hypothetical protein
MLGESVKSSSAIKKQRIREVSRQKTDYEYIEEEMLAFFPQSRYFQIHFQHCHDNAYKIQQELFELKQYIVTLEEKLDRMMKILDEQTENI